MSGKSTQTLPLSSRELPNEWRSQPTRNILVLGGVREGALRERVRDRAEEFRAFGGFKKAVVVVPVLILWGCLPFDGALLQDIKVSFFLHF